jgi:hypothetical protein
MNEGITDADLQMLLSQNVLAAEQLRRIVAERLREELQAELEELQSVMKKPDDTVVEMKKASQG